MFDNKTLKVQPAQETLFPRLKYVCVCVCGCLRGGAPKRTGKLQFELRARPNDQIHTKYVKMAMEYESIHLNTVYVLSGPEQLEENPMRVNILS